VLLTKDGLSPQHKHIQDFLQVQRLKIIALVLAVSNPIKNKQSVVSQSTTFEVSLSLLSL